MYYTIYSILYTTKYYTSNLYKISTRACTQTSSCSRHTFSNVIFTALYRLWKGAFS